MLEHSESLTSEQEKFKKDLAALIKLVDDERVIYPFMETSSDLVTLDTGEVVDPLIAQSMYGCEEKEETLCRQFIEERLEKCVKPISDTIPRTGLYAFSNRSPVDKVKMKNQLSTKSQVSLTTKLFISYELNFIRNKGYIYHKYFSPYPGASSVLDVGWNQSHFDAQYVN